MANLRQGERDSRRFSKVLSWMMVFACLVGVPFELLATPVSASQSPTVAVVQGAVDCSNMLSTAGFAGSPSALILRSGPTMATINYPRRLPIPGSHSIFGSPALESYKFKVPIPHGLKAIPVHWTLSCQDKDGQYAGTQSGQFTLARRFTMAHPATRNICNHGGTTGLVLTICNPALNNRLGACAWAVLSAGIGGSGITAVSIAIDPPKSALQAAETALSLVTSPLVGLIIACAPVVKSSPTTTVPPSQTTTTTATVGSGGWPVHRNDGSPAFFAYLGASFLFPDWTSCDPNYCLAESGGTVYVFAIPLNQIATISASVSSPSKSLTAVGISAGDVQKLLAPTG